MTISIDLFTNIRGVRIAPFFFAASALAIVSGDRTRPFLKGLGPNASWTVFRLNLDSAEFNLDDGLLTVDTHKVWLDRSDPSRPLRRDRFDSFEAAWSCLDNLTFEFWHRPRFPCLSWCRWKSS